MKRPDFVADLLREELVGCVLDAFYRERGRVVSVQHVPVTFQRMCGIDRVMSMRSGQRNTYEDKADFRAGDTGNLFIETWSKRGTVRGWAYTSGAQYLDCFIASHRTLLWGETLRVKHRVREWETRFPARQVVNQGYVTEGITVPILVVVEEASFVAWEIPEKVVREGVVNYCTRRASDAVQQLVAPTVVDAVGELWEYCQGVIPPEPRGRIAGIPYATADDVSAILEKATQRQVVADKLQRDGEASEAWFRRIGARLAPVIDQLRADGYAVTFDAEARTYRLVAAGQPPVEPLPLFEGAS